MRRGALIASLLLVACEEHGKSPDGGLPDAPIRFPDARSVDAPFMPIDAPPGVNPGFAEPAVLVQAWTETSPNTFQAAMLDLSCLKQARVDPATTAPTNETITVTDFQSGNTAPGASVAAFRGMATGSPFTMATADGSGVAMLTVPSATTRIGYRVNATNARPTLVLDRLPATTVALKSLSNATAQTLPALIGVSATPTSAIEIGTITDCQGHTLSGTIATVGSVSGFATHLTGADTYYFSDSVGLPVRHSQAMSTTKNGLFMVIELPATASAFIQVWGFTSAANQSQHMLTELAELAVPVPQASAIITLHDPRATQ